MDEKGNNVKIFWEDFRMVAIALKVKDIGVLNLQKKETRKIQAYKHKSKLIWLLILGTLSTNWTYVYLSDNEF
jgi:hypothetical protein